MNSGRFFKRKELWVPTWRAWLLGGVMFLATTIFLIKTVPYFLAPTQPVHAKILVIEGWLGEEALDFAKALAKSNRYDLVLTAGGRIENGFEEATYGTFANLGARRLRAMGYTETNLVAVPSKDAPKDRTYHSALAVRDFLWDTPHRSLDLVSDGVHSRRSWFLYCEAMGGDFQIGIYAAPSNDFHLSRWWVKSAGVRKVISESIAFVYARLFFSPTAYEAPSDLKTSTVPASSPVLELPPEASSSPP